MRPQALDPTRLHARFSEVEATTDIERVAVLALAVVEAGLEGLDTKTAEDLYRKLGLRMPLKWRSTFSNAAAKAYIYSAVRRETRSDEEGLSRAVPRLASNAIGGRDTLSEARGWN